MTPSAMSLDAIELQTRPDPDATVVVLHGLGADGYDFVPVVREFLHFLHLLVSEQKWQKEKKHANSTEKCT